jgi:hypothetical protein
VFDVRRQHEPRASFDIVPIRINAKKFKPTVSGQRNAHDTRASTNEAYYSAIYMRLRANRNATREYDFVRRTQTTSRDPVNTQMPIMRAL